MLNRLLKSIFYDLNQHCQLLLKRLNIRSDWDEKFAVSFIAFCFVFALAFKIAVANAAISAIAVSRSTHLFHSAFCFFVVSIIFKINFDLYDQSALTYVVQCHFQSVVIDFDYCSLLSLLSLINRNQHIEVFHHTKNDVNSTRFEIISFFFYIANQFRFLRSECFNTRRFVFDWFFSETFLNSLTLALNENEDEQFSTIVNISINSQNTRNSSFFH